MKSTIAAVAALLATCQLPPPNAYVQCLDGYWEALGRDEQFDVVRCGEVCRDIARASGLRFLRITAENKDLR